MPTKRIYYLYEAWLTYPGIGKLVLENHNRYSDADLENMALEDARSGGKGRANAIFTVPLADLSDFYRSVQDKQRVGLLNYKGHQMEGNIPAILDTDSTY